MNDPIQVHPKYVINHEKYGYVVEAHLKIHVYDNQSPTKVGDFCLHPIDGYTVIKSEQHLKIANYAKCKKALVFFIHPSHFFQEGDLVYAPHSKVRNDDGEFLQFRIAKENDHPYRSLTYHKVVVQHTNVDPDCLRDICNSVYKDGDQFYILLDKSLNDLGEHEKEMFDNTGSPYPSDFGRDRYNFQLELDEDNYVYFKPRVRTAKMAYMELLDTPEDYDENHYHWFKEGFNQSRNDYDMG